MVLKDFALNGSNNFKLTAMTFKGLKFKFDSIEGIGINIDGVEGIFSLEICFYWIHMGTDHYLLYCNYREKVMKA
jgi:hypothetical protein